MSEKTNLGVFFEGVFSRNPIFVLVLGLCPALAVTTSLENAIGLGIATMGVLVFSCVLVSLIRHYIPSDVRIPAFIVIIATFVTIANKVMEAYFPPLHERLGIYIPLIVVNCMVMGRVLAFAYRNPLIPSVFDSLGTGFGFTGGLALIGFIREILGSGKIVFMGETLIDTSLPTANAMILPPGALLTIGVLLWIFNLAKRVYNG